MGKLKIGIAKPPTIPVALYPNTFPMFGNVGIGTGSPGFKLHVMDKNPQILIDGDGGSPIVSFRTAGDTPDKVWALYKDAKTGELRLYQNGDKVTVQNGTGNTLIGLQTLTVPSDSSYYVPGRDELLDYTRLEVEADGEQMAIAASSDSKDYMTFLAGNAYAGKDYAGSADLSSPVAGGFGGSVIIGGDLWVLGKVIKDVCAFKIDHPLDPANRYLYHSAVESPDMMNLYCGNAVLNDNGEAWVKLPAWFEALNRDFHYQLTCIGGYAPVYVKQEIRDNRFKIAGGKPRMEVSWQVTGVRHDRYAEAHRIPVEEKKPKKDRGYYLHPELYRQPKRKQLRLLRTCVRKK